MPIISLWNTFVFTTYLNTNLLHMRSIEYLRNITYFRKEGRGERGQGENYHMKKYKRKEGRKGGRSI